MRLADAALIFVMIWFAVFLVVLQIRPRTQDEAGDVVPGTPRSAPAGLDLARKVRVTTLIAVVLMAGVAALVSSGVTPGDLLPDWLKPPSSR